MSRLGINTGSNPNDGQGDPLRVAMGKINSNFLEIYNTFGDGFSVVSYASSAGISTLARNLTGSPRINVSGILNTGITTTEHIQVVNITSTGVVTATQFVGDGSQLTNVTSTASGVSIYDDGVFLGVARELDFDANIVSTSPDGTQRVRISATGLASAAAGYVAVAGYSTASGIATNVIGGISSVTQLSVSGLSTFAGITTVTGVSLFTRQLSVSGVSTFAGITTHTASLFGTQASFSGIVTASSFSGDGSQLTGIVGSSGIIVRDDGTLIGTAGTINFGSNLNVSAVSAGVVTVTGTEPAGISTTGTSFFNQINASGIITGSSFVKSSGTSSQFLKADGSVDSSTYLTTTGSATNLTGLTGASANTYGNGTAVPQIVIDSNGRISSITNVLISGGGGGGTSIIVNDDNSLVGAAGTINFGTGLSVTPVSAGVVTVTSNAGTATSVIGGIASVTTLNVSGVSTFTGIATFKSNVCTTELGNQSYDGIRFLGGASNFALLQGDSLGNLTISCQSTATRFTEINGAHRFYAAAGVNNSNVELNLSNVGTTKVGSAITFTASTGNIFGSTLTIGGVSTFAGITTHTASLFGTQASFTGVVTATRFESTSSGTPTIDSPNNLNINAVTVAISTDLTVGGDAYVGLNTSRGLILRSPNGTQYRLIVDNSGNLSTVLVP